MRYLFMSCGQLGGGEEGVQAVGIMVVFAEKLVQVFVQFTGEMKRGQRRS